MTNGCSNLFINDKSFGVKQTKLNMCGNYQYLLWSNMKKYTFL